MSKNKDFLKTVDSRCWSLGELFHNKFSVDFYQREYVWERKQLEDLINDLSNAFLACWVEGDQTQNVKTYDPYFMGEIVISDIGSDTGSIIDGQQRITTFTLLLIYILHKFKNKVEDLPISELQNAVYSNDYGLPKFNLDIDDRKECMYGLFKNGTYESNGEDKFHTQNLIDRYNDIEDCWNDRINPINISCFAYWILGKVFFSKVVTNSDEFAYVIFESMNDRGLSLTRVEMLRSYLLANVSNKANESGGSSARDIALQKLDRIINKLANIKLPSKSKAEEDFFRVFFRTHYAENLSQGNSNSDFVRIGNAFHRWVRENEKTLNLHKTEDYIDLIEKIDYFSTQYEYIYRLISERNTTNNLYLIVNNDYGFTLQPVLILASINYKDSMEIVNCKIQIVSKYLTRLITWRVWNHWRVSQSTLEAPIYELCKKVRETDIETLKNILSSEPIDIPLLENSPTLNQQNKQKIKVMLSLITEIVAQEAKVPNYILNKSDSIEVEHIWSDHFDQHIDEFKIKEDFDNVRNNIGDLLVLPKTFNTSYGDDIFEDKVKQYFGQDNILAQSLYVGMYMNHPEFTRFIERSGLLFKPYKNFKKANVTERAELYKSILKWNWQ